MQLERKEYDGVVVTTYTVPKGSGRVGDVGSVNCSIRKKEPIKFNIEEMKDIAERYKDNIMPRLRPLIRIIPSDSLLRIRGEVSAGNATMSLMRNAVTKIKDGVVEYFGLDRSK